MDSIDSSVEFLARALSTFFLTGTNVESLTRTIEASVIAYELTQLYTSALQTVASFKQKKQHSCRNLSKQSIKIRVSLQFV
jgi:hypothetical protein